MKWGWRRKLDMRIILDGSLIWRMIGDLVVDREGVLRIRDLL